MMNGTPGRWGRARWGLAVVLAASVVFIATQWERNAGSDGTSIQWQPGLPSAVAGVQPGVTVTAPAVGNDPAPTETAAAMTPTPSRDPAQASGGAVLSAEQRRTLAPNELGLVPVLMYHDIIDVPETGVAYTRTLADFRAELQRLYDSNYYVIPLQDLVAGQLSVPAGKHPVVLTFDDGIANQFRFLIADDGSTSIDPTSAVGVLEAFFGEHADFGRGGFFAVPPATCFDWTAEGAEPDQRPYCAEKLQWLLDNGYEVGNHTYDHADLLDLDDDTFREKVGAGMTALQDEVAAVPANILAMPFGNYPDAELHPDQRTWLREGFTYDGNEIQIIAALMVGANPAVSPFSTEWDPLFIARIQAYDGELGSTEWLDVLAADPSQLYTSDGDVDTITIPSELPPGLAGTFAPENAAGKTVIHYDPTSGEPVTA
jgi:peptidoglycan/xylan/chitin deacetylase (PgdA/CDA1 family)